MDMNWVVKYVVPIVTVAISAATLFVTFFLTFVWVNFREHPRRLQIIDLATKRIAFWNQFLSTVYLATNEFSSDREAEQDKARQAILRIHAEAAQQMEALVRSRKISRAVTWRAFKPEPKKLKKWLHVLFWWYYAILSGFMLLIACFVLGLLEYRILTRHPAPITLSFFLMLAITLFFIIIARFFLFHAEELKHDTPPPPIIDAI
jgi:hypothetical protein